MQSVSQFSFEGTVEDDGNHFDQPFQRFSISAFSFSSGTGSACRRFRESTSADSAFA